MKTSVNGSAEHPEYAIRQRPSRATRRRRIWRNDLRDALAEAYTMRHYRRTLA